MNNHSCIIDEKRPSDFLAGTLPFQNRIPNGDWTPYLPDFDTQRHGILETEACVPFTAVESVETQINFLRATGQLPQTHIDALTQLGFFDTNGSFHASERYIAKLDGTTMSGTSMPAAWDAIRKYGLVPYADLPFDDSVTTWDEFYAPIPQALIDKGKQFLNYFDVSYEWLTQNNHGTPVSLIQIHLSHAPLCIGTPVCEPWDQLQPPTCPSLNSAHSTMIFHSDTLTHILDHYSPFEKTLDETYNIMFILKGVVTVKQFTVPILPLPQNIAITQNNVNILTSLVALYQKLTQLFSRLKGRNLQTNTMSQPLIGFLRGAGYAALTAVVYFVSTHLTGSGLFSDSTTAIVVALLGALEHFLNDPGLPPSVPLQQ